MRFRFLGWSLAGFAVAASATPHDGLKIVARETFPAGTHETTTYVTSDRARVETRMASHVPDGGTQQAESIILRRCDLARIFLLHPAERTYEARPLQMNLSGLERLAVSLRRRDEKPPGNASLVIETTTVDTGERRMAFGHTARHVLTTRKDIPVGHAGAAGETVTDGWYIDLETRTVCEREDTGRAVLVAAVPSPGNGRASLPRVTFKDVGAPERGFAIETRTTWRAAARDTKDSLPPVLTYTVVSEVSSQQFDAGMFEVPPGFRSSDGMFTTLAARWSRTAQIVRSVVASWFR